MVLAAFPAWSVEAMLWKIHHAIYLKAYKKKARCATPCSGIIVFLNFNSR